MPADPGYLRPLLRACWSDETSRHWRPDNPARGQCNVTALVVHDLFGGEILKTETPGGWHFYNRIDGKRHDLTDTQFDTPVAYTDQPARRDEALAGTTPGQYRLLESRLRAALAYRDSAMSPADSSATFS